MSAMAEQVDHVTVLIAGGGPSGLAAALELGRAGVDCRVLEPRIGVHTDRPRAKTTSARTMELLRRWGLADRLRSRAPLPVSYAQDVVFCTRLTGRELTRFRNAFGLYPERREEMAECGQQVPQPLVEEVLREAVTAEPAVELRLGERLEAAEETAAGVRARVAGADGSVRTVTADYLLGCDGSGSTVRTAMGARYQGGSGRLPNLNITFSAPGLHRAACAQAVHYWVVGRRPGGIIGPMDLDRTWWAIAHGVGEQDRDADPEQLVRALLGPAADAIPIQVLATDPWSARMLLADRYRSRRTFLVGDAAHLNPPWGGHGFNTCVGDAVNLGWKLAAVLRGWGGPALLDSYEAERRPVARHTIDGAGAEENRLARAFTDPLLDEDGPAGEAARAAMAERLQSKHGEFHSLGLVLGYHYAGSPVVVDDGSPVPPHRPREFAPTARPGARLPHCWLPDGGSLYDRLAEHGFTLLRADPAADASGFADEAAARGLPLSLLDLPPGVDAARWGAAPLLLVRPDQHVAWRGTDGTRAGAVLDAARGWG
jgi:2-polyprenyl-6-methoxyphenol hydroxylase-like FAD-dependent oxidoreductase